MVSVAQGAKSCETLELYLQPEHRPARLLEGRASPGLLTFEVVAPGMSWSGKSLLEK